MGPASEPISKSFKHIRRMSGGHNGSHKKDAEKTSQASLKVLGALPGYEAQLLPTLKDTIDKMTMTEKVAKRQDDSQGREVQERTDKRASMGFAGIGAGAANLVGVSGRDSGDGGARGNVGLGMGPVRMSAGVRLMAQSAGATEESDDEGKPSRQAMTGDDYDLKNRF